LIAKLKILYSEKRQELVRFLKFCVVGTIGTAIDFGVLNLLYNVLGFHQVLSNVVSVSAATISNYTWSRFWVYPETRHQHGARKFGQFVVVSVVALGLNTTILWITDHWFLGASGHRTRCAVVERCQGGCYRHRALLELFRESYVDLR
jgi:putative flippase GtrA